ncbi:HTH/DNA binding domain protein [Mycobacterium phage Fredward]|uniref:HTH DNA binding protein n=1 Tax=Mycobacterium phage Fredward TaxID=1354510 RepID=UPI0003BA183E|nr:HTH DNA binding protein [Mycobacterium phage Fredward]AGY36989.1 HTH/DNA binding domain protein [Mycobacterium phage Fredward]QXN73017.1 helix-turn-helix DNA binding domain protein [Mycobacterium phage Phillis]
MSDVIRLYELLDEIQVTAKRIADRNYILEKALKPKTNRKKLTAKEVHSIREAARMGRKNVHLAYDYDVNPATISRIVRGIYHKGAA